MRAQNVHLKSQPHDLRLKGWVDPFSVCENPGNGASLNSGRSPLHSSSNWLSQSSNNLSDNSRDHSWQKSVAARDLAPHPPRLKMPCSNCCCGNRKENEKPKVFLASSYTATLHYELGNYNWFERKFWKLCNVKWKKVFLCRRVVYRGYVIFGCLVRFTKF